MNAPAFAVASTTSSQQKAYFQSVDRSSELLSCAKTAVKVAKNRQGTDNPDNNAWWSINPSDLSLHQEATSNPSSFSLETGLDYLREMQGELHQLEGLVRRRGHTNDPTEEITRSVQRLESDTQALSTWISSLVTSKNISILHKQRTRHWEMVQQWFQAVAHQHGQRLQDILKVRGTVLAEQAMRRKRFQTGAATASATSAASKQLDNPLFAARPRPPAAAPSTPQAAADNGSSNSKAHGGYNGNSSNSYNGSYHQNAASATNRAYSYYGATSTGYGGGASSYYQSGSASSTGMRQRRPNVALQQDRAQQQQQNAQYQLQQVQQERQTVQRLKDARQAEQSLAQLGQMFGQMSNLVAAQSEVLSKVEDDVEAAHGDVTAGRDEITILYQLKKGNRPLIIKTFLLLNFFIVFMKVYGIRK